MNLLDRLLATHWAMDADHYDRVFTVIERHASGIRLSPEQIQAAIGRPPSTPHPRERSYQVHQGIALVPLQGVLSKHAADVNDISAPSGTSYESFARDMRVATSDPEARGIMVCIESGGGVVDGGDVAIEAIRQARLIKPVRAHGSGMVCSMAYRIGMQCEQLDADRSTLVGSIGVLWSTRGTAAQAEKNGVRYIHLRSGKKKAPGQAGEDWNEEQLGARQRLVDQMADQFFADVSAARGLTGERLKAITDGDAYLAADGKQLGLVDQVRSFDDALSDFVHAASIHPPARRPAAANPPGTASMKIAPDRLAALIKDHQAHAVLISSMAAGSATNPPSTEAEIVAAIQAADGQAVVTERDELKKQLAQAKTDHQTAIAAKDTQISAKDAEIAQLKADLELEKGKPKGVTPLEGNPPTNPGKPDAVLAYEAKKDELAKAGDKTPADTIARKFPAINQAFIAAVNKPKKKEA